MVRSGSATFPTDGRDLDLLIERSTPGGSRTVLDDVTSTPSQPRSDPSRRSELNGHDTEADPRGTRSPEVQEQQPDTPGTNGDGHDLSIGGHSAKTALDHAHWLVHHHRHGGNSSRSYRLAKRLVDLVVVGGSAPLWAPVLALAAGAVWMTAPSAPVLFRQSRTGESGRRFEVLKLRTMVPNAEELKRELAHLNEREWPDFKISNDPRITLPGRILRKTSLDELPQLLNILRGDMSLVGPRPHSLDPSGYDDWHHLRFGTVPGLTGLWQVHARTSRSFNERVRLDIAYIERQSLLLDASILLRTIPAVLEQRGSW